MLLKNNFQWLNFSSSAVQNKTSLKKPGPFSNPLSLDWVGFLRSWSYLRDIRLQISGLCVSKISPQEASPFVWKQKCNFIWSGAIGTALLSS